MPYSLRWTIGLATIFLAACAVNPVTPPGVAGIGLTGTATAVQATVAVPTSQPLATDATVLTATQAPAAATDMPPSQAATLPATMPGPTASPTPLLVVIANVALLPVPTATRPAALAVAAQPRPTATTPAADAVAPTDAAAATDSAPAAPVSDDVSAAELYCVDLINAQRSALGLPALAADPTLMGIANSRVADMVTRGYTGHNDPVTGVALGPSLMAAAGYGPVGENWYGSRLGPPAIADVAMRWFMTDAPHYQNILSPRYTGVGVGIAYNGKQWLLIQDFGGN